MKHSPGFEKLCEAARQNVREVSLTDVHARLERKLEGKDEFTLIDVREDNEYAVDHLPDAVHFGRGVLERDIEANYPDPNTDIVLYCGGGYRSALAAESLQKMGYTNVTSMAGGVRGWREAALPLVPGASASTTRAKT
jgi:rhodanese-related sulfurtransferase